MSFVTIWTIEFQLKDSHTLKNEDKVSLIVRDSVLGKELHEWNPASEWKFSCHLEPSREQRDAGDKKSLFRISLVAPFKLADILDDNDDGDNDVSSFLGHFTILLLRLPRDECGSSNTTTLAKLRVK